MLHGSLPKRALRLVRTWHRLAGLASRQVLDSREEGRDGYWPRVWALRGLRYAYSDAAASSVIEATADRSWRVREMAAKVILTHAIDDGLDPLGRLVDDPVVPYQPDIHAIVVFPTAIQDTITRMIRRYTRPKGG